MEDYNFYGMHERITVVKKIATNLLFMTAAPRYSNFCSLHLLLISQYLKITEKVLFHIASELRSEASKGYSLSGQKFIENAKNGPFWLVFENVKLAVKQSYQTGHF